MSYYAISYQIRSPAPAGALELGRAGRAWVLHNNDTHSKCNLKVTTTTTTTTTAAATTTTTTTNNHTNYTIT